MTYKFSLLNIPAADVDRIRSEFPDAIVEYRTYWSIDQNGHEGFVGKFPSTITFCTNQECMIARLKWNLGLA
jgi:hypothetical protein